jgi:CheY-like chemotaxis protein
LKGVDRAIEPIQGGSTEAGPARLSAFGRGLVALLVAVFLIAALIGSLAWSDTQDDARRMCEATTGLVIDQTKGVGDPAEGRQRAIETVRGLPGGPDVVFVIDREMGILASNLRGVDGYTVSRDPRVRRAMGRLAEQIRRASASDAAKASFWVGSRLYSARGESPKSGDGPGWTVVMVAQAVDVTLMVATGVGSFISGFLSCLIARPRLSAAPSARVAAGPGVAEPKRATRVLVVDDSVGLRRETARTLMRHNCSVIEASSCDAAILAWGLQRFDFVLMDMNMPGQDGCETAAALRCREPAGTRVPILCLTSHPSPQVEERALEAGMDGILAKPLDVVSLVAALRRARSAAARRSS